MPDICVRYEPDDFEYDVFTLFQAFFHGSSIKMLKPGEEAGTGHEMFFRVGKTCSDGGSGTVSVCELDPESGDVLRSSACSLAGLDDRIARKNELKRCVYRFLADRCGRELPWGALTGIRPVKLAMQMLEEGQKNSVIAGRLREEYCVSTEKAALAVATANREKAVLDTADFASGYSLYIGIPFCPSICLYCSFGSHELSRWGKYTEDYLEALKHELCYIAGEMKDIPLHSVYIGGGTPTTLSAEQLEGLLAKVTELFDLSGLLEFTVEAGRPDTVTEEKLAVLQKFPVNRISINPQTMNQETLDLIGRRHTAEDIREKFFLARRMGFRNINMDLIVGLPGEGKEEVRRTLEQIRELSPDALTVHSLALKRATRLNLFREDYVPVSFENSQEIMRMTTAAAAEMGMGPYYLYRQKNMAGNFENVGYSVPGCAGLYNILIMEEKQTIIAAGSGGSSKFVSQNGKKIERVENVKDLLNYIGRIDEMIERKQKGIDQWRRDMMINNPC